MDPALCTECLHLELLDRPRWGVESRCPRCRCDRLRTEAGTVYGRRAVSEPRARPRRRGFAAVGVATLLVGAVTLAALAAGGLTWLSQTQRSPAVASTPSAPAEPAKPAEPPLEEI